MKNLITQEQSYTGTEKNSKVSATNNFLKARMKYFNPFSIMIFFFILNFSNVKGQGQLQHCKLICRDTTVCFGVPDSLIILPVPRYVSDPSNGGNGGIPCPYDSIWNNAPNVFPVGTTVVTWYVHSPFPGPGGTIDSCTSNVIRKPPSPFSICFTTSPPIVGGVINICNGTPITFNANCSIGSTGVLWNFGNGYYSGNYVHTEPASHYPPGTYYDTLRVYDDCGNPHDTAFQVVVDSASGPDIYCISVVCPGDTVTYRTNANCTTYNWGVFGGLFYPATPPTGDTATVIWGPGPNGTISLSVSGCTPPSTCNIPTIKTVKIVPATLPVLGDSIVCAGAEVTYCIECIPGNTHTWEMTPANAGTITGQGTCCLTIKFNPNFFGTVTLTVNYQNVLTGQGCNLPDGCGNDHGCGGSGHLTIQVRPIFGISGPAKVCPNALSAPFYGMNLTNNTIEPLTSWKLWKNGVLIQSFANTTLFNNYAWFNGPGTYQVTAYAPPNIYCNDSAFVTVVVVDMLVPNPILGPDTVCPGVTTFYTVTPNMNGVSYTWTLTPPTSGTLIPPLNNSSIGVQWNAGGGTLTVVQTLTASPFCVSPPASKVVKTWPNFPLPVITPSGPIACLKGSITYSIPPSLLSNATYQWSVVPPTAGNITTANGTNTITINWVDNSITPIKVKLKITRCYSDSVLFPVTLFNLPLVPNISFLPTDPCVNVPVAFTTTSPGTWNWSFGDLATSIIQNPIHPYAAAGDYNIQLYVTNAQGCSDTAHAKIHVDGKPVIPNIAGPTSVCLNTYSTYSFPEPLYTGASYTWSLSVAPKGTIISSSSNSLYLKWTSPGTDTVKVHVQSTCLDTTIKYVVQINTLPTAGILVPSPACEGTPLTFTGSGGVSYAWLFTGGTPSSAAVVSPVVNYPTKGIYGVSLTVTDANGCVGTTNIKVTINPKPLAIITGPFQICAFPATITVSAVAQAGYTFAWTPSGVGPTITPTINAATTFSCVVTNSFGCSRTSNSITVDTSFCPADTGDCNVTDTVNFNYTPPICLTDSFIKTGNAPLVGWNFGDGSSAGAVSPVTHTFPYPGIFLVTVKGIAVGVNSFGAPCTTFVSKSKFVTIPFDAQFDYSFACNGANQMQTIFTNTSLYLNAASNYQWKWYDNGNLISSVPFPGPILISPAGPHVIDLVITDNFGTGAYCKITQTINVPVPITASYTVSSPVCQNNPVTFTDTSPLIANEVTRLFTAYPAGPTTPFSPDSMIYTSTGIFVSSLTVTDIYGCSSTVNQNVNVLPAAVGTITVDPNNCDSVKLTAAPGAGPFTWIVISPPPFPDNPVYVKNSGFYKVKGVSGNGCPYTAGPVQVTVKQSPNATITGKVNYCQGEKLDIKTSTGGGSITWNRISPTFQGGLGFSANLNIVPFSPATGTQVYQVVILGANGCTGTATYTVFIDTVPTSASIVASGPTTFCDGDSVVLCVNPTGATYLWSKSPTPALSGPANTAPCITVKVSGTYNVIVQTANGCPFPAIPPKIITVNPNPVANITGDTVLCEGETLILTTTNLGGVSYSWTGPGGTQTTNPYIKSNIQLGDAGQYIVTVTDNATGCSASDTINVIVNPAPSTPVIVSNPGGVLCQGPLFNFCVVGPLGPPIVYSWNTGQLGACINAAQVGDYYVTATNQFGCSATSNVLTIHPLPDLSCVPSGCYDFCNECSFVVIPGPAGFASYEWQKLSGPTFVFYSATQNLIVFPPGGKYRLLASNQWGCADSTDTLEINFHDCCEPIDSSICRDTCLNFNDVNLHGFIPNPLAPNVIVAITNTGSQGGASDYFVTAQDQPGASQLLAGTLFNGKWCCGEFCFDYKLVDDGTTGSNVNPAFVIKNGTLGFSFTSNTVANVANGWHHICAPIADCETPPTSTSGTWAPIAGTLANQWQSVISFVTEVDFRVDYIASTTSEISGYDNICLTPNQPSINAGPDDTICAGQTAILHVEGCNGIPKWYGFGPDGPFFINQGPEIDVTPTVSTCYMVVCCTQEPCCCDTDTVCVIVNPLPVLQWPVNDTTVCLNTAPIFLDASQILVFVNPNWVPVTSTSGTGFFSGTGVIGTNFYPTTLGAHIITYTYTDSLGCTSSITRKITVIDCPTPCNNGPSCQINAGPDQSICIGQPAILHVTNCNSIPSWLEIGITGNTFVGTGQTIDVFPQHSTCYMVICCPPAGLPPPTCCCDTDTVCITVNPLPVLQWPTVYSTVCLNSGPIFLDENLILVYVNNMWVPVTSTTGSGVFSGINVTGTFFNPVTVGTFTITYTYTDPNGCVGIVTNTITVINCCIHGPNCDIDAGPDDTICVGQAAILHVENCNSTATWYALGEGAGGPGGGGPTFVGEGQVLDVFPQHSTCYIVICCNPAPCCCDTDTVCITVNPLPILQWPTTYDTLCQNSAPIFLNANNILVLVNNVWTPVTITGGSGFFSGPGVAGNYFYPTTLGSHTITYTYTDPNGCTSTITKIIYVKFCPPACDNGPNCQINAGPDQIICAGQPAILHVENCNSVPSWFELKNTPIGFENVFIGHGELDVFPQTTTCYIVICCNPPPCCCDTDTVCITVKPKPILKWQLSFSNVCLNSAPIFLDASNIFVFVNNVFVPVTGAGGNGFFSGPNVVGNYFYPNSLGTFTITYTYTDPNGCTGTVTNIITVIYCCINGQGCDISAGPDQTICFGQPAILQVEGCNSHALWYKIAVNPVGEYENIFVGAGEVLDVFPQSNTCYLVICCNPPPCCCDTDTVCITVNPLPILTWPLSYANVCLNSTPIFLDANNIFVYVNNVLTPVPNAGGTGFFAGTGVGGNYFYPTTLGTHVITYYYTDANGCQGSVTNTITVIDCGTGCSQAAACQINAGPDQSVCLGQPAILHVENCNSNATWFEIGDGENIFVGNGQTLDVFPHHNTCYMVICCNPPPCCCDTDTVCITIKPLPILTWPLSYNNVCLNSAPIFLDASNIFVLINNTWVSIPNAGGFGSFSGTGVVGNSFYPTTLGVNLVTYTYIDANGCTGTVTNTINVINCDCDPVSCNCNVLPPPPPPTITIISVDPDNCDGHGCIHATFTGCCLLYSYTYYDPCKPELSYSVPQSNSPLILCNLKAGTYTIFVQDMCGNLVMQNVVVPLSSGPLTANVTFTTCGGPVCVEASGGCPPYTYNWGGGITTQCINGEPCTERTVTVTDSRGCTYSKSITIPGISFTNVVKPSCCLNNGRICANVCFGPKPYIYHWNTPLGQTTPCINGLAPGIYCLTVTNALGQQIQCCYNLIADPIIPPTVKFIFNNCGSSVQAVIGESKCEGYTYHWENNSHELVRNNLEGCDSLTFTIVTCDGAVYHHGFRVPRVFPTITPVNCLTGLGRICVPSNCFRCEPYSYSWASTTQSFDNNSSCLTCGPGTYTVCITNACGDVICCQVYLPPPLPTACHVILHLNILIQGFYTGQGMMNNSGLGGYLYVTGNSSDPTDADSVYISAMTAQPPYALVDSQPAILKTNGDVSVTFDQPVSAGTPYYIRINHHNGVETWSKTPVMFAPVTDYLFTTSPTQAYGDNLIETFDSHGWAIYNGDVNQDKAIDATDFLEIDPHIQNGDGGYSPFDINGDGAIDATDFLLMDPNIQNGVGASTP